MLAGLRRPRTDRPRGSGRLGPHGSGRGCRSSWCSRRFGPELLDGAAGL